VTLYWLSSLGLHPLLVITLERMPVKYKLADFQSLSVNNTNVKGKRSVCSDENDKHVFSNNIHVDCRVVRGNTYASPAMTEDQKRNKEVYERTRRSQLVRKGERPPKVSYSRLLVHIAQRQFYAQGGET